MHFQVIILLPAPTFFYILRSYIQSDIKVVFAPAATGASGSSMHHFYYSQCLRVAPFHALLQTQM